MWIFHIMHRHQMEKIVIQLFICIVEVLYIILNMQANFSYISFYLIWSTPNFSVLLILYNLI